MVDIASNALPRPGQVYCRSLRISRRSGAGNMVFGREPDEQNLPRRWLLSWREAPGAVADALRRHYRLYHAATFEFTIPRTGEVVTVQYAAAPQIRWSSAAFASATAEIEEPLAHR
jgi:hypothetical protein